MNAAQIKNARAAVYLLPDECAAAWHRADSVWKKLICEAARVKLSNADLAYEALTMENRVKIADKLRNLARLTAPILRGLQGGAQ